MVSKIIIDEGVFDERFTPETLVCREGQAREIARCLAPVKSGKFAKSLYIHGPPGIGKTSVAKWILREHFENNSVYVNCWNKRTSHKIMEDILLQAGHVIHGRESTSDLIKKFEKSKKKFVVCLDESDHIKDSDILYTLARNSYPLVMISNRPFSLSEVDYRITSSLSFDEVEFKPYNRDEILSILRDRVTYGMKPGSINDNLLSVVAGMCNGDARIGLHIMRSAAMDAELNGRDMITLEHIKNASKSARKYRLSYVLSNLNQEQRIIYEILQKNKVMDSGQLFEEYRQTSKNNPIDRTYRNYMQKMKDMELVREIGKGRWKKYEIVI
ncbi:MAG TPA: AAA family ATPase [Candidatus Nitrosotalea sp.]|nr:AAA family ATPase [Candidatus Nitrosotalea sp.]